VKTFLYFVGKPKDAHLNAFAEDFLERAARFSPMTMREVDPKRFDPFSKHPSARVIALDPSGSTAPSEVLARWFAEAETLGRDMVFLVGGHAGLTPEWRRAPTLLSLSPMTFSHELARAILAEQIFRAFAILRGHPYVR
jgi:23S rRNA (pseudouridine1915-N3)-methyltransferase